VVLAELLRVPPSLRTGTVGRGGQEEALPHACEILSTVNNICILYQLISLASRLATFNAMFESQSNKVQRGSSPVGTDGTNSAHFGDNLDAKDCWKLQSQNDVENRRNQFDGTT
jgi:hypothetical protein